MKFQRVLVTLCLVEILTYYSDDFNYTSVLSEISRSISLNGR